MSSVPKPVIRKRLPWGWLVLLLLGVLAVGFSLSRKLAPLGLGTTSPVVFRAGERNPLVTASGYLVARHRATLSAKVPGRVAWLGVEEGSRVARGQVIARLEDAELRAGRDQTATQLAQAEADLRRGEALARAGVLDRASLDRLRSTATALRDQLRYQEASLENMVLRAPFAGTVTQKLSEVGETVSPGSAGGANAINAVAVLADFDSLEVEVEVPESSITRLHKGMPVEIRVDALEGDPRAQILKGELREIYPTSNRQKAVVVVRVAFLERDGRLLPDMGAKVTFLGEPFRHDVVVLGREQVVRRGQASAVWVAQGGRATLHPVKVVAENPVGLEVEGLDPASRLLVIPADLKLQEGARVKVRE
nr:efflux RND transporter periplasmic adaptor subunit [uncultured Holophaga sp.]